MQPQCGAIFSTPTRNQAQRVHQGQPNPIQHQWSIRASVTARPNPASTSLPYVPSKFAISLPLARKPFGAKNRGGTRPIETLIMIGSAATARAAPSQCRAIRIYMRASVCEQEAASGSSTQSSTPKLRWRRPSCPILAAIVPDDDARRGACKGRPARRSDGDPSLLARSGRTPKMTHAVRICRSRTGGGCGW
ncbi:uncharacterized protein K452DRAFT_96862 [Aplosporella prunicola CBS 121167]|uniref:Uncharacterized protein n=1 Tax=Aplosporella prunicola CBS 121167 TaxID=1176127 RepID=A0A6A6B3F7_9PEZI|nr:uncharacterized protein K452DRAFT_96862 [Aplosporella prunicola CBS 121167]KAF2137903.1 hypothetical protein K452DRAFT_96862 [Aplosporella prunicola CBS 121167]